MLETGGWKLQVIDHAADDARVEQDHHAALLGFGIQREIARVVVVAAWIDDLQPSEAAVGELGDLGGFGLIDVDHREGHDQVWVAFVALFDQVVALARTAQQANTKDVQPLAVVGQHVEHAVRGVDRQRRAPLTPGVVNVGVEHARRGVFDVGGSFDLVHASLPWERLADWKRYYCRGASVRATPSHPQPQTRNCANR